MSDDFLIDTNILVYAYDSSEHKKREKSAKLVASIFKNEKKAHITNQIVAELFSVLTNKIEKPIQIEDAEIIIDSLLISENWIKIDYTSKSIRKAIKFVKRFSIPFWDALIAATMIENNIFTILTEDSSHFKKIPGLKVINPLQ